MLNKTSLKRVNKAIATATKRQRYEKLEEVKTSIKIQFVRG